MSFDDEVQYQGKNSRHTFQIVECHPYSLTRHHFRVFEGPRGFVAWGQTRDDAIQIAKHAVDAEVER
jgi:hypothetical protein